MSDTAHTYIVAAVEQWNHELFQAYSEPLTGSWYYAQTPSQLDELLLTVKPRYIFFLHWRWLVPEAVTEAYECVCFHMTNLPYGRGGSPLQNLILRGHTETVLTALRMNRHLDEGPIYCQQPLSLAGRAETIYRRASELAWQLIRTIIQTQPDPVSQTGDAVYFKRRKPAQSKLPEGQSLQQLYDFIRMLDAPGYPLAFCRQGEYRLEFKDARLENNKLVATTLITRSDAET